MYPLRQQNHTFFTKNIIVPSNKGQWKTCPDSAFEQGDNMAKVTIMRIREYKNNLNSFPFRLLIH